MKTACATCQHLIKDDPFYWCGLESKGNFYVDVSFEGKPLEIQPEWCLLLNETSGEDDDDKQ